MWRSKAAERTPTLERVDPLPLRDELREVHRSALGAGALSDQWVSRRLPGHVGRDDFAFLVARRRDEIEGFAYGYRGVRGQWWTDHVAEALGHDLAAVWVDRPHFEVVELHVRPSWQRRGLGTALLDTLLDAQPYAQALLSTRAGSEQARRFYAKNDWLELAPLDFGPGYPAYLVLGKRL
jgi:ribosomal protein S18 acetylase RimI-like enzyme